MVYQRALIVAVVLWAGSALAQSSPNFIDGAVLCANTGCTSTPPLNPMGLNQAFMQKLDAIGGVFGSPTSIIGTNIAPIFNDGANLIVQNSAVKQSDLFDLSFDGFAHHPVYDLVRSVAFVPPGSMVGSVNGFASYIDNQSASYPFGNAVNYYSQVTCSGNSVACWGANPRILDSKDGLPHTYSNILLIGTEYDFYITSPGTVMNAVAVEIGGTAAFSGGNGVQLSTGFATNPSTGRPIGQLLNAFVANDGVASGSALIVGSPNTAGLPGTGASSMQITWDWWDTATPSVEHGAFMFVDAAGFLNFQSVGGLLIDAAVGSSSNILFRHNVVGNMGWQIGATLSNHFYATDEGTGNLVWEMISGSTFTFHPPVAFLSGITAPGLATASSGGTAGYVCIDGTGNLYKKATPTSCP